MDARRGAIMGDWATLGRHHGVPTRAIATGAVASFTEVSLLFGEVLGDDEQHAASDTRDRGCEPV